jgi:hypothetical protein
MPRRTNVRLASAKILVNPSSAGGMKSWRSDQSTEKERRRWESNPRIMDLQSTALATWLRRLIGLVALFSTAWHSRRQG